MRLRCGTILSLFPLRLYETIATLDKRRVSKYCLAMVADYLTCIATSASAEDGSSERPFSVIRRQVSGGVGAAAFVARLPVPAAAALQRGVFSLVSCLDPSELQHLHTVLGQGQAGARQRAALAALRTQYEKSFKFEGKV